MRNSVMSCLLIMCILLSDIALRASSYKNQGPVCTSTRYPLADNADKYLLVFAIHQSGFSNNSIEHSASDDYPSSPVGSSVGNDSLFRQGSWFCTTPNGVTPKSMKSYPSAQELAVLAAYTAANYGHESAVDHGVSSPSQPTPKKNATCPKPRGLHGTQTPLEHGTSSPSKTPKKNRIEQLLMGHGIKTPLEHGTNGSPRKASPKKS